MTSDRVGVGVSVDAPDVTLADLTLRDFRAHAVQVRGEAGASRFTLHNALLQDTGQQLLKGSVSGARVYADDGVIACSEFRYTISAPSDYTNGVDLLATRGWIIRDNHFSQIRGPATDGWKAGPAILVWVAAGDTRVERNVIVDSFRGIALGLTDEPHAFARNGERAYDHDGGLIRNNVVVNLNRWADEAIEANAAPDVRIEHNTVFVEGTTPWAIGVRFAASDALVRNNLTNRRIFLRDGGRATLDGNVLHAQQSWFVDATRANMRSDDVRASGRRRRRAHSRRTRRFRPRRAAGGSRPGRGRVRSPSATEPAPRLTAMSAAPLVSFIIPVRNDAVRLDTVSRASRRAVTVMAPSKWSWPTTVRRTSRRTSREPLARP